MARNPPTYTAPDGTALTETQLEAAHLLPGTTREIADDLDTTQSAVRSRFGRISDDLIYRGSDNVWHWVGEHFPDEYTRDDESDEDAAQQALPDLSDVDVADDADPSVNDLSDRERYIVHELQTGTTLGELAEEIDERETIVSQYLRDLKADGWDIYIDETAEHVTIEGDHAIRSSEHKGTRTRKANQWWERRHTALVRDFKSLPDVEPTGSPPDGEEEWVHALGDIHAGDEVLTPDGTNVYNTDTVQRIIRYDTAKSLELYEYHGVECNTAYLVWNGDFITNEGIYTGQFEDLDAWLDEQHDCLMEPLLEQINAYSQRFDEVRVIAQVGNHGQFRASGVSRQANADLVLYKSIRNAIAAVKKYGEGAAFDNVGFTIGQARPYTNFRLLGGQLKCHVRHGDNRPPQATTRAGSDDWKTTLLNHEFDLCFINHHHISGRVPWDGPPVVVNGTSKPPSDFVDKIAASTSLDPRERAREISHCVAVADHGVTGYYPVKTHDFDYVGA